MKRVIVVKDLTVETVDVHPGRDYISFTGGSSRFSPLPPGTDEKMGLGDIVTTLRVEQVPIQRFYRDSWGDLYVAFRGSVHDALKEAIRDQLFGASAQVRYEMEYWREYVGALTANLATLRMALVLSWSLILVLITALIAQ